MAKTMARIDNGVVINLEWVDDNIQSTNKFKDIYDLQIEIGDTYSDGRFYRNGAEVLTYRQQIQNILAKYDNALTEIEESIVMPMSLTMTDETPLTIDDRKQIILSNIEDIITALELVEVVASD